MNQDSHQRTFERQGIEILRKHWYVVLHGKKQGEPIDDIENGDPRSFTPMIINKDDDVLDDVHATRKDHNERIYT